MDPSLYESTGKVVGSQSPLPSHHSNLSLMSEEDMADFNLSEDEGVLLDKPTTTGLFRHDLFKTLLFKANTTANMEVLIGQSEGCTYPKDPTCLPFIEPVTEKDIIPSPKLFVDVIQRQ